MKKNILELLLILLFLTGVGLFLSQHIKIAYALGISECRSFPNNTLDYMSCKIVPGSLVFIVKKSSIFFSVGHTSITYIPLIITSVVLLGLGAYVLVRSAILYTLRRYVWFAIYFILAVILIIGSGIVLAQTSTGQDIYCYRKDGMIICHSLYKVEDGYFYFRPSRYPDVIEKVPYEDIYGKVILSIPDVGGLLYSLTVGYEVAKRLGELVKRGEIPTELYIKSFREK